MCPVLVEMPAQDFFVSSVYSYIGMNKNKNIFFGGTHEIHAEHVVPTDGRR